MSWSAFWGAVVGAGGVLVIERVLVVMTMRRINRKFTTPDLPPPPQAPPAEIKEQ